MSSTKKEKLWNSLEVAKIITSFLTPLLIVLVGFWINMELQDLSKRTAQENSVIDQRTYLWKRIAEPLNDIYAYNVYVGSWKSITPENLISHKRELDKIIYSNRPFFSNEFVDAYNKYINEAFETNRSWGLDA